MNKVVCGNALEVLKTLEAESVDCVVTSPPYWSLRDYGCEGQLGLEPDFMLYVKHLCDIFDEVKRVLKKKGTCWVNLGDSYGTSSGAGSREGTKTATNKGTRSNRIDIDGGYSNTGKAGVKGLNKSLCQIPSRFAIAMTDNGWILRNTIIWHKRNCMPSSANDRFTVDYEFIFFFVKSKKYYFEQQFEPMVHPERKYNPDTAKHKTKELASSGNRITAGLHDGRTQYGNPDNGRNKRCVWDVTTEGYPGSHFAVFPPKLIETPIKAGCPEGGVVLDPFAGHGTTAVTSVKLGRKFIAIDVNPEYCKEIEARLETEVPLLMGIG